MKKAILFILLISCINLYSQTGIQKTASVIYFDTKINLDSYTPNIPYGSELAYVIEDSTFYSYNRNETLWGKVSNEVMNFDSPLKINGTPIGSHVPSVFLYQDTISGFLYYNDNVGSGYIRLGEENDNIYFKDGTTTSDRTLTIGANTTFKVSTTSNSDMLLINENNNSIGINHSSNLEFPLSLTTKQTGTGRTRGVLFENILSEDAYIFTFRSSTPTKQRQYFQYEHFDGINTDTIFYFGNNREGAQIFYDATLGYHPLIIGGNGSGQGRARISSSRENNYPFYVNWDGANVVSSGGFAVSNGQGLGQGVEHNYFSTNGFQSYFTAPQTYYYHPNKTDLLQINTGSTGRSLVGSTLPLDFESPTRFRVRINNANSTEWNPSEMRNYENFRSAKSVRFDLYGSTYTNDTDISTDDNILFTSSNGTLKKSSISDLQNAMNIETFYNSDFTMTENRTIDFDGNLLFFDSLGVLNKFETKKVGGKQSRFLMSNSGIRIDNESNGNTSTFWANADALTVMDSGNSPGAGISIKTKKINDGTNIVNGVLQSLSNNGNVEVTPYSLPSSTLSEGQYLRVDASGNLEPVNDIGSMAKIGVGGAVQNFQSSTAWTPVTYGTILENDFSNSVTTTGNIFQIQESGTYQITMNHSVVGSDINSAIRQVNLWTIFVDNVQVSDIEVCGTYIRGVGEQDQDGFSSNYILKLNAGQSISGAVRADEIIFGIVITNNSQGSLSITRIK